MEIPKTTIKPRDFGVGGLKALTNAIGEWDNPTEGISISYSLFFDGRNFIDPHSNLTIGRLYGVKCPWISRAKEAKERYSIIWQSKDTHPKADMEVEGCPESYTRHSHRGMYQRLQQVVRDCVKDISQCWKGVSDQVWEYDADDFSKPRHDEDGNRTNATNLNNPDMQYYLKQECDIPKKYEWDKVRKKVKYTFGTLYTVLQFVPNAERHCRFFRTPLPKEYRVPDDIVTKVTQKLLAGESLTTASGYLDVKEYGESVRNRMRALNVITDEKLLMKDTEVMY